MAQEYLGSSLPESATSFASCQTQLIDLISAADTHWADPEWRQRIEAWRQQAANTVFAALKARKLPNDMEQAEKLLTSLGYCGAMDFAASPQAVADAQKYAAQGWPGIAAAAMLVPCWQASFLPALKEAPRWLMPFYATYSFSVPRQITAEGQAEAYARVFLSSLDTLVSLLEANRGSALAQSVLERFRSVEDCAIVALAPALHREIRIKRARLVACLHRQPLQAELFMSERTGRPLHVGIVARTIADTAAAKSLVRLFERLPITRITTALLVERSIGSAPERQLVSNGAALLTTGDNVEQIAQSIRDSSLDIAIFLMEGPWLGNPLAELALRRIVPVQIVHDGTGLASGFPQADLYTASPFGREAAGEKGMLVTPAGLTGVGRLQLEGMPEQWARATIGMEGASCVFGHFGGLPAISIETITAWARVLAAVPDSRFAIIAEDTPGFRIDHFCATLAPLLERHGVASARVAVFGDVKLATHEERKAALSAFDVLLDGQPTGNGEVACAAVAAHRPMVTWAQPPGAAAVLLHQAGLVELVASDTEAFVTTATKLGCDETFRLKIATRLEGCAVKLLAQYDSFAVGEAFGELLEQAYDAVKTSRKNFRSAELGFRAKPIENIAAVLEEAGLYIDIGSLSDAELRLRSLLLTGEQPVEVRRRLAGLLGRQGQHTEAVDLLVTVVEMAPEDPAIWLELGLAARQAGNEKVAMQALQNGLQLDPKRVESWQILAELAREMGNYELLDEIETVLRALGVTVPEPASLESIKDSLATL